MDGENQAAIHIAARHNNSEFISFLMEKGAYKDLPGEHANTVLHIVLK